MPASDAPAAGHNAAADDIRSYVERVERLEEEKKELAGDIKEVFAEAKGRGYSAKILRQVIRLRKLDRHDREAQIAELQIYWEAVHDLPLFAAADARPRPAAVPPGATVN
ncbi:hypothetical protein OCH7691_04366 [Oceanibacterium hippocampi]|uniref:GapR-like DNA-binding domain-containing protein n=2 Tax=Oceanibacterium hippocampi TaxID=745714 RepID=A0A1Y5U2W8_9PROT|nr:hypothetical protein OCH7691_04366 [Oceanibacterium hippocampi]